VRCVSFGVVVCGSLTLVGMLIWAYRLDADFSARYACCTREAVAAFHRHFWSTFFVGAKLSLAGCLGLAATLASKTALRAGCWTLGASILLLCLNVAFMGLHNWSGSTEFTITQVVCCAGTALLIIGGVRVGWTKLHP
jgi:hypothetical protein